MEYRIDTKQTKLLNDIFFKSLDEVLDAFMLFDLLPPFNVYEGDNVDVTESILCRLKKEGYVFVDKKKVVKLLPKELIQIMNKNYRKVVMVTLPKELNIKLVHEEDIKSIIGFYELWEQKAITIGHINKNPVFYDTNDNKIYFINKSLVSEYEKKEILYKSVQDFINAFEIAKQ